MMPLPHAGRSADPRTVRLALVFAAGLFLFPAIAFGQSVDAKAAYSRLSSLSGEPTFAASFKAEAAKLASVDDVAWLAGNLAASVKAPAQKKALLIERASLLELLGRYAEAAGAWESASTAVPGVADAACLLSAAACRLTAGDGEAAAGLATAVAFSSPDKITAKLATIVAGWAALARGEREAAAKTAGALASDPEPRVSIPALLLGRASTEGAEQAGYEKALAAYSARPESSSTAPLLLMVGSTAIGAALTVEPAAPAAAPLESRAKTTTQPAVQGESFYQVGAFRDEANAKALAGKLEGLGLKPLVKARATKDLYIVYVGAGPDPSRTVLILKDAGYEAWAVESVP